MHRPRYKYLDWIRIRESSITIMEKSFVSNLNFVDIDLLHYFNPFEFTFANPCPVQIYTVVYTLMAPLVTGECLRGLAKNLFFNEAN